VSLDDERQILTGYETITYFNQSPDTLRYLWLQLNQNNFAPDADGYTTATRELSNEVSFDALRWMQAEQFDGGMKIDAVSDARGASLHYVVVKTMMRVDLPAPLAPGKQYVFKVKWHHNINNHLLVGGRGGYEFFPADSNYLYEIAQWFPQMCVYDDARGWQHKQFLGRGEFALTFGNYLVRINVPADHVVASTGTLQNPNDVLSPTQRQRLAAAYQSFDSVVVIVSQDEATAAERTRSGARKTWIFKADNVRDFAWASSRKFIWDAMAVRLGNRTVLAQSYYPKEGNPLWGKYSTQVVAHTIRVYSKFTVDYPYPQATSVHGPVWGMEYPMICFNGGRPEPDGTYSDRTKYGMISVIIHEVGHNWFPMIINSDERQWTWMDEGLNTYCQFLAEQEWQPNYPSRRGHPVFIVPYMAGGHETQVPIMTNSESILQFGNNAYGKPATALNILRETVLGRELFDFAFREYSRRWAFKHPNPADLFRTMEDATGVDLDWFWRGWFYTTNNVDIAIAEVKWWQPSTGNPDVENALARQRMEYEQRSLTRQLNARDHQNTLLSQNPSLRDFYNDYDPYAVTDADRQRYERFRNTLTTEQRALLEGGYHFYEVKFKNIGGLVMPLILEFEFEDGSKETRRVPAEVWRLNEAEVNQVYYFKKPVMRILLDPLQETADVDMSNNTFPAVAQPTRFRLYQERNSSSPNPMQQQQGQGRR
jgi:hypothetical protein